MSFAKQRFKVKDQDFRLVVLRVESSYEDGTPENCTLIRDDVNAELSRDSAKNQFVVALWPLSMLGTEMGGERKP